MTSHPTPAVTAPERSSVERRMQELLRELNGIVCWNEPGANRRHDSRRGTGIDRRAGRAAQPNSDRRATDRRANERRSSPEHRVATLAQELAALEMHTVVSSFALAA